MKLSIGTGLGVDARSGRRGPEPAPAAPANLASPRLIGEGRIGAALALDPGTWRGSPAPRLAFQWRRGGADVPGATGRSYAPGEADDGAEIRCRVTAANPAGTAIALSDSRVVTYPAPAVRAALEDLTYLQNSGVHTVDASSVFTGASLTFRVEGEGVSINPETGELSIATDRLTDGIALRVTAANSGGTAESVFRLTVRALPVDGKPALIAAPALVGEARIGAAVQLDAGVWSGTPEFAYQWQLDGADIAGAVGLSYTPQPEDDGKALACRITARNAAGAAEAVTAAATVRYPAPVASGALDDLVLALGAEPAVVEAAPVFTGANLGFAVEGKGATIDAATGRVTISTDVVLADEPVTVLAVNSGGSAESSFRVTVGAVAPALVTVPSLSGTGVIGAPLAVAPGEWSGAPQPAIALQWLRDGAEIAGAVEAGYVPGPADDGKSVACRVTARNEAGAAEAVAGPVAVTYAAPLVTGGLADVSYVEGSGDRTVDAAAVFAGDALVFAVQGADATIDPATGVVTIPTDSRRSEAVVTVTASNSGGAATVGFRVTVEADIPDVVMPSLIAAPALAGTARIGSTVTVEPGEWSGGPALAFQWLRDGAAIDGATAASYVPVPADDATELACRVTASNSAGSAEAVTDPLGVTYVAPTAQGDLPELILDEDSGDEIVEAAGDFTGENLTFAVAGAGATIDPATGRVTIPTAEPLSDLVTVSASNSGGTAESRFQVTVEGEGIPPLRPDEWQIITIYHPTEGTPVVAFRFLGEAPVEPGHLFAALGDTTGTAPGDGGWHQCVRHPEHDTPGHAGANVWIRHAADGSYKSWLDITPRLGTEESFVLRYALDPTVPVAEAEFSPDSDRKTIVLALPGGIVEPPPSAGESAYVILRSREEYAADWPNGAGMQQQPSAAQCLSYPDMLIHGQDMGSIWVSTDHGRTRFVPRRVGLTSWHALGVAIDPLNPRRMAVYAPAIYPDTKDLGGLFFSTDGGQTFERKWAVNEPVAPDTHDQMCAICYAPGSTKGTAPTGYAQRWYACLTRAQAGDMPWLMSDDGGQTWSKKGDLGYGTYGVVREMAGDPSNGNVVWMATSKGLFRIGNAAGASSISAKSGSGGLPGGAVNGPPYVSSDGRTIIVGVSGKGVYKSTNGGDGWSAIYTGAQSADLRKLFVNHWNPAVMGFTVEDGAGSPRFTKNGWSSSYNPTLEKRPGYSGGLNESYQHCHIFFHREAGRVFYMGCHKSLQRANSDWRSEDHGATMTLSVAGFDGVKASTYHSPQLLHPTDQNEFYLVGLDGGANYTANGGKWFDHINFSKSDLGTIHSTACGACMVPGQRRLVIGIGRAAKGKLVIYQDGQFYRPFDGEDSERLMGICYDQDNPKYVFGGRYKNDNYGHQNSWSKINNFANSELVVMGCSLYDPAGQCLVAAAPTGSSAQKQEVWRSLDRAGSWSRVISANYNLVDPQGAPFRVHPRDRNVLFTWTPDKRGIRKWDMRNGTAVADFDLGIPNNVPVKVGNFSIDPRYPDHMYVVNVYPGTGYGLMRTTDGGKTWQSLDHLVGACNPSFLEISPVTGNIFHGGANGTDVLRPAYRDPKDLMDTSDFYPSNRIQGDYIRV